MDIWWCTNTFVRLEYIKFVRCAMKILQFFYKFLSFRNAISNSHTWPPLTPLEELRTVGTAP